MAIITAKELREKREPARKRIQQMRDLITDQHPDFTAEERAEWEKVNKDYDGLTSQLVIAERGEAVETQSRAVADNPAQADYDGRKAGKALTREERVTRRKAKLEARMGWLAPSISEEERANAIQGWMRVQQGMGLKWFHEEACRKTGISPHRRSLDLRLHSSYRKVRQECRALAVNVSTAGGFTVPEGFVNNFEAALLDYANPREWADVMRTESGQDLPWPTVNDTTQKGRRIAENATVASKDVTVGQMVLHAYKYTSDLVLVPAELLEDSAFDLASWLGDAFGVRIGRIQADEFTTGTGASMPFGYVAAAQTFSAASSTAIGADDLYKLKHKVDPAYRKQPGVGWTLHDQTLLQIKLLKDGFGRYLWQAGLAGGRPDTIDGDPLFINQSMDSTIASGKKTVAYGALKKFKIRDVSSVPMRRLVERYADSDQEGFVMFSRSDANLLDAGTHPIYVLQH